jgi:hypothetical protein
MCARTIAQHGIVLSVVQKIPSEWGGSNAVENLWALCEPCRAFHKEDWRNLRPQALVFKNRNAVERLGSLFLVMAGIWIPQTLLKAVAGNADWPRTIRQLRGSGYDIVCRRGGSRASGRPTYYSLRPPDH